MFVFLGKPHWLSDKVLSDFKGVVEHDRKPVAVELTLLREAASILHREPRLDFQLLGTSVGQKGLEGLLHDDSQSTAIEFKERLNTKTSRV